MQLEWLIDRSMADETGIRDSITHVRDDVSYEWLSSSRDLEIHCVRGQTRDEPVDVRVTSDLQRPRPILIVPFDTPLRVDIPGIDGLCKSARGKHFWFLPAAPGATYHLGAQTKICIVGFSIAPEFLAQMAPERKLIAPFETLRERGTHAPFFVEHRSEPALRAAVAQLLGNPYRGRVSQIFAEGKALEIITTALNGLALPHRGRNGRLSTWEMRRVQEARDCLITNLRTPPSSSELARAVGLPLLRFERAFREHFGTSVFRWLQNYKLDLARELLQTQPLPIKEIAYRLGYAHTPNFIHAFRRRFGKPPGAVRCQ